MAGTVVQWSTEPNSQPFYKSIKQAGNIFSFVVQRELVNGEGAVRCIGCANIAGAGDPTTGSFRISSIHRGAIWVRSPEEGHICIKSKESQAKLRTQWLKNKAKSLLTADEYKEALSNNEPITHVLFYHHGETRYVTNLETDSTIVGTGSFKDIRVHNSPTKQQLSQNLDKIQRIVDNTN